MVKRKVKRVSSVMKRLDGRKPTSGRYSKQIQALQRKIGGVTMDEIKRLEPSTLKDIGKKIELMDKWSVVTQKITDLYGTVGGRAVSSLTQNVDLQVRLLDFEDKFKKRQGLAKERVKEIKAELESGDENTNVKRLNKELFKLEDFVLQSVMDSLTWQNMRKQLASEIQFIHKHGLDAVDVQSRVEARKKVKGDDTMFDIDVEVDKSD